MTRSFEIIEHKLAVFASSLIDYLLLLSTQSLKQRHPECVQYSLFLALKREIPWSSGVTPLYSVYCVLVQRSNPEDAFNWNENIPQLGDCFLLILLWCHLTSVHFARITVSSGTREVAELKKLWKGIRVDIKNLVCPGHQKPMRSANLWPWSGTGHQFFLPSKVVLFRVIFHL